MSIETLEQTFNVSSPARLKLSNIRGSVEILPGEAGVLTVTATKHSENGDPGRTKIYLGQAADGEVTVETRFQDAWWAFFSFSRPCQVDYQVHIPPMCEIDASCVSSSLAVRSLEGKYKLSTVSGGISLEDLTGEMKISSVSGEISGVKLAGALHLNTVSGEVRLVESSLTSTDLTTVSGEIRLQTELTNGPYRFHSVSGHVWLSVPVDTRCSLDLHSVSGSINVNLPVTRQKIAGGYSSFEVQGGGVRITANSVSGSLFVETVGNAADGSTQRTSTAGEYVWEAAPPQPPAPPSAPEPPEPSDPKLDRKTILDRIEDGEMSVEEGLKALEKMI